MHQRPKLAGRGARLSVTLATAFSAVLIGTVQADDEFRLSALQRCGDLMHPTHFEFCLKFTGGTADPINLVLNERALESRPAGEEVIRFSVNRLQNVSGPLWLEQGDRRSNAAWLSMQDSATMAAVPDEVAENTEGINTYVDLVSIIVEEAFEALPEAQRLAGKYNAKIVGAIPPLRIYQFRLPVDDLVHRDALVLRLNGEESVDSAVVEESSAEEVEAETAVVRLSATGEVAANRFMDAVDYYRRRIPGPDRARLHTVPMRVGVIERSVDFDAPDFRRYLPYDAPGKLRLFARDASAASSHGTAVVGVLVADWDDGGNAGFLSGLDDHHAGIDIIVDRGSDAGITENVATSVRLVQDGVRVLNWSWGIHRVGALSIGGNSIDSVLRSGVAFEGYEELLEEFFKWLRTDYPDVIVVNSAGNSDAESDNDDYRLPSSFLTPQLLVVGAHQRADEAVPVESHIFAEGRGSSNIGVRVDITAAGCIPSSNPSDKESRIRCGTSYSTPLVTGVVTAMLGINPKLTPLEIRQLLRRSSMPIGADADFEPADTEDLTAPILPSERAEQIDNPDVGRSARLDMHQALLLTVESLSVE